MTSALKLTLLSDGIMLGDGGGAFGLVPRARWMSIVAPDAQNRVPMALWSALFEVDGKRFLIDAGVGDKQPAAWDMQAPRVTLLAQLAAEGVQLRDIDVVILTHLHGDHCGWLTRRGPDGALVPTFERARHVVQRVEANDALNPNERTRNTYFAENFKPLIDGGILELLDGQTQLTPHVRVVPAPGHTAGHQAVVIEDPAGGPPIFFVSELATFAIQFARLPWVTAYDVLPMVSIETKRRWQILARDSCATVIGSHDSMLPYWRIATNAKGLMDVHATEDPRITLRNPLKVD